MRLAQAGESVVTGSKSRDATKLTGKSGFIPGGNFARDVGSSSEGSICLKKDLHRDLPRHLSLLLDSILAASKR